MGPSLKLASKTRKLPATPSPHPNGHPKSYPPGSLLLLLEQAG